MDGEDIFASSAFLPLPFRVLSLIGLGILCWATNLHILHLLGIDTPSVLEARPEKISLSTPPSPPWPGGSSNTTPPASPTLHRPRYPTSVVSHSAVYRIFTIYAAWVFINYIIFSLAVKGDMQRMDPSSGIIAVATAGVVAALFCPFDILQKRERDAFLHAIRRCLFPSSNQPVYFCDVILADIFTSFAKVIGDVWVSVCMMLPGGSLMMSALDIHGWSEWMIPALISVPYVMRFRQCLAEYYGSKCTNTRALANAFKYASSFPVIFLSAMQKLVVADVMAAKGAEEALQSTWHGEHGIFRLWLLSVCVSTLYSFWWDVTNDWGLDLLRSSSTPLPVSPYPNPIRLPLSRPLSRQASNGGSPELLPVANSLSTPPHLKPPRQHPYGLRSPLLYGYPLIYYIAIIINLILRFTWSMKLSTHLHTFAELETGVFVVEACELLRRWLWVFFRVEWEVCKKGGLPDALELEVSERERDGLLVPMMH